MPSSPSSPRKTGKRTVASGALSSSRSSNRSAKPRGSAPAKPFSKHARPERQQKHEEFPEAPPSPSETMGAYPVSRGANRPPTRAAHATRFSSSFGSSSHATPSPVKEAPLPSRFKGVMPAPKRAPQKTQGTSRLFESITGRPFGQTEALTQSGRRFSVTPHSAPSVELPEEKLTKKRGSPKVRHNSSQMALKQAPFSKGLNKKEAAPKVRLNKFIAMEGTYSRREADGLIFQGHVRVNKVVVKELGTQIYPQNVTVTVKGKVIEPSATPLRVILYNKAPGTITSKQDELGRKTIYDYLPPELAIYDPVGRLDRKSSGLLLLTNDGNLLYRLTHPSFHVSKRYQVELNKPITQPDVLAQQLLDGIHFEEEDVLAKVEEVWQVAPDALQLRLITGYNRQIRRMLEACGYDVERLKRLSFANLNLGNVKPGSFRMLKQGEVMALKAQVGLI